MIIVKKFGEVTDGAIFKSFMVCIHWAIFGLLLPGVWFGLTGHKPVFKLGVLDCFLGKF